MNIEGQGSVFNTEMNKKRKMKKMKLKKKFNKLRINFLLSSPEEIDKIVRRSLEKNQIKDTDRKSSVGRTRELETELSLLRKSQEKMKQEIEDSKEKHQLEIQKYKEQLESLQKENKDIKSQVEKYKNKAKEFKESYKAAVKENEGLKEELDCVGYDFEEFTQNVFNIQSSNELFSNNSSIEEIKEENGDEDENRDEDENESSNAFKSEKVQTYSTFLAPTEKISGSSETDESPYVRFLVNFTNIRLITFQYCSLTTLIN